MKNIHVLSTEKLSKGYIVGKCIKELSDVKIGQFVKTHYLMFSKEYFQPHNIYITSDEIPKYLDHYIVKIKDSNREGGVLGQRLHKNDSDYSKCKKIILTTDPDLIKVQAIDDEFLKWFVKNPSCENVKITMMLQARHGVEWYDLPNQTSGNDPEGIYRNVYKIIIPKEEPKQDRTCTNNCSVVCGECQILKPKQETVEEAALIRYPLNYHTGQYNPNNVWKREIFTEGAKWQAERMYSERELEIAYCTGLLNRHLTIDELDIEIKDAQFQIDRLKKVIQRGDYNPEQP